MPVLACLRRIFSSRTQPFGLDVSRIQSSSTLPSSPLGPSSSSSPPGCGDGDWWRWEQPLARVGVHEPEPVAVLQGHAEDAPLAVLGLDRPVAVGVVRLGEPGDALLAGSAAVGDLVCEWSLALVLACWSLMVLPQVTKEKSGMSTTSEFTTTASIAHSMSPKMANALEPIIIIVFLLSDSSNPGRSVTRPCFIREPTRRPSASVDLSSICDRAAIRRSDSCVALACLTATRAAFSDLLRTLSARRNPHASSQIPGWRKTPVGGHVSPLLQGRASATTGALQCRLSCRRASCFARRVSPSPAASGECPPRPLDPSPVQPRRARDRIERLTLFLPNLSRFRRTGVLAHRRDGVQCARVIRPMASAASSSTETAAPKTADLKDAAGKDISGSGIRRRFLEFYEQRGHARLPSSSLVPEDPTVLLTIAGMLQFKPVFMGQAERAVPCATTTQKCVRTNDIENVGVTARHHTFFEMLGNFSFGDYFKKEAIQYAWELATKEYGLDETRVYVSVFREDDEAYAIWRDVVGVPDERIKRMDEADNFWAAGPTGPCGPCSELYWDFHPERGAEGIDLEDDSRFIEFYNLVFMEMNRDASGKTAPLKNKNIDTGMGLERMAQILQGKPNNYETDLIRPIIDKAASMAGISYDDADDATKLKLKVIGDHTRAVAYLVSDGVLPSNVGRVHRPPVTTPRGPMRPPPRRQGTRGCRGVHSRHRRGRRRDERRLRPRGGETVAKDLRGV